MVAEESEEKRRDHYYERARTAFDRVRRGQSSASKGRVIKKNKNKTVIQNVYHAISGQNDFSVTTIAHSRILDSDREMISILQ